MNPAQPAKSRRSFRSTIASIADVLSGAGTLAAAAESGRRPSRAALDAVGIDAASWDRIGKR